MESERRVRGADALGKYVGQLNKYLSIFLVEYF